MSGKGQSRRSWPSPPVLARPLFPESEGLPIKRRSVATGSENGYRLARLAVRIRLPFGHGGAGEISVASSSSARGLLTRLDTGHRCNKSSATGFSTSVPA